MPALVDTDPVLETELVAWIGFCSGKSVEAVCPVT